MLQAPCLRLRLRLAANRVRLNRCADSGIFDEFWNVAMATDVAWILLDAHGYQMLAIESVSFLDIRKIQERSYVSGWVDGSGIEQWLQMQPGHNLMHMVARCC